MSIFEYDEEKHMKSERKEWREIGRKEGLKAGFDIIKSLMDAGKYEEAKRALSDNDYREQLCQNYFLHKFQLCQVLEEYQVQLFFCCQCMDEEFHCD